MDATPPKLPPPPWGPEINTQVEQAGALWKGVLPGFVITQIGYQLAWILKKHPIGVDLMSMLAGRLIGEMPSPETHKNRLWRSYQCMHLLGEVTQGLADMMRKDGVVAFALPKTPAIALRAFLCWAGGTPIMDLPHEFARGMLDELCDGLMAASFLGLLQDIEARPKLLAEWGPEGPAVGEALPRMQEVKRGALARMPVPDRRFIETYASCAWDSKRAAKQMRMPEQAVHETAIQVLRTLGLSFRVEITGQSEEDEEEALFQAALALYGEAAPAAGDPRVAAEVARATALYRGILPEAVLAPMGKALAFFLTHHPVGLGIMARTAPEASLDAPLDPAHRAATIRGYSVVNSWRKVLEDPGVKGQPGVVLPEVIGRVLVAFIGLIGDLPKGCWLEASPRDQPGLAGLFGDAVLAAQVFVVVQVVDSSPSIAGAWGPPGQELRASLPNLRSVTRRVLARLPPDTRIFFEKYPTLAWDALRCGTRLQWPVEKLPARTAEVFQQLGAAFRAELMTN